MHKAVSSLTHTDVQALNWFVQYFCKAGLWSFIFGFDGGRWQMTKYQMSHNPLIGRHNGLIIYRDEVRNDLYE